MRGALRLAGVAGITLGRGLASCLREPGPGDLGRWAGQVLSVLGVEVVVEGPVPATGQVWVANHLSWLDPLALLSLRPASVLAKAEVASYPIIGTLARRHGLRFVRRESLASRTRALKGLEALLGAGDPLLLFPEGTTTRGPRLAPLYRGGLAAAYRQGASLLTLHLSSPDPWYPWVGDDTLLPHLGRLARVPRTRVLVRPGELLHPADFQAESAWLAAARSALGGSL